MEQRHRGYRDYVTVLSGKALCGKTLAESWIWGTDHPGLPPALAVLVYRASMISPAMTETASLR